MTEAAHAKNKSSFNPDIQITTIPKSKTKAKSKLRFEMGTESRGTSELGGRDLDGKTRMSKRKHTVQNTSATVTRLKQSQAKRVFSILCHLSCYLINLSRPCNLRKPRWNTKSTLRLNSLHWLWILKKGILWIIETIWKTKQRNGSAHESFVLQ